MSSVALVPTAVVNLTERNELAKKAIASYATGHAAMDVGIGLLGTFVPGGGLIGIITSLIAQGPVIYKPMVKQLAIIYESAPDKVTDQMVQKAIELNLYADLAVDLGVDLASEFGAEFFQEIATELIQEVGLGAAVSFIPFAGGVLSAALDATIAATLTWRVGTMTAMYFMNDGWIHDRKTTYERAKQVVGHLSAKVSDRVDLDAVARDTPEIRAKTVSGIINMIQTMKALMPDATKDQLRTALVARKLPKDLIDEALRRV